MQTDDYFVIKAYPPTLDPVLQLTTGGWLPASLAFGAESAVCVFSRREIAGRFLADYRDGAGRNAYKIELGTMTRSQMSMFKRSPISMSKISPIEFEKVAIDPVPGSAPQIEDLDSWTRGY